MRFLTLLAASALLLTGIAVASAPGAAAFPPCGLMPKFDGYEQSHPDGALVVEYDYFYCIQHVHLNEKECEESEQVTVPVWTVMHWTLVHYKACTDDLPDPAVA